MRIRNKGLTMWVTCSFKTYYKRFYNGRWGCSIITPGDRVVESRVEIYKRIKDESVV